VKQRDGMWHEGRDGFVQRLGPVLGPKPAEPHLQDAEALLQGGRYDAAYYLAGYAVECAIKACIANQTRRASLVPGDR
jgi:hypothetical protein